VQENRTPDNLLGAWAGGPCAINQTPFPGADINNGGYTLNGTQKVSICNVSQPMNNGASFDPGHQYEDWNSDYNSAAMDGFCHGSTYAACQQAPSPYSYVQASDVQPYYAIASTYGFANYMFQTNEGPSFPAHQFLFTGTSAPVAPNDPQEYFWDFVRDNPLQGDEFAHSGCPYDSGGGYTPASWIHPDRTTLNSPLTYECYPHDSLMTGSSCNSGNCDKYPNLTWTYYSPTLYGNNGVVENGVIWNAPEAILEVCYGINSIAQAGTACGSAEWSSHMSFYSTYNYPQLFSDIDNCKLANISWVIPDVAWSDHPGFDSNASPLGPSWVGNIVNLIGASYANSNHVCDYWGTSSSTPEPTAIFIVWDDWGGFYDHMKPPNVWTGSASGNSWICPAPNQWGCGYTYGFRVPLMVVSEFTGTLSNGQYGGYISGPCGTPQTVTCPNQNQIYQHDFGSILNFTEYNFNLNRIAPPYYADNNAPDAVNGNQPLSDFFGLWTSSTSVGRPFVQIPIIRYPASFFQSYYTTNGATPTGPDTD
jgi:phospholipase C